VEEEARGRAEHAKRQAEEVKRQAEEVKRQAEEAARRKAEEDARREAEAAARKKREAGLAKGAEGDAALRAQDYERALSLYKEADALAPGEEVGRKGSEAARAALASLEKAETDAASKEKSGDLEGAVRSWEAALGLRKAHGTASREIERVRGLIQ